MIPYWKEKVKFALIDIGTHALDLTLWMMNNYEPASVTGSVFRKLADQTDTGNVFGEWDPQEFTVEDSAFGFIRMKDGATVNLKAGADMKDGLRLNYVRFNKQCVEKPALDPGSVRFFEGDGENEEEIEQMVFYNAIAKGEPLTVPPEQTMVVTRILEAVYESAKTVKKSN